MSDHISALKPLDVSNDWLGDPARLQEIFEQDGYLFFRDVLDKAALAKVRAVYLAELEHMGVTRAPQSDMAREDAALEEFPFKFPRIENSGAWEEFVRTPSIHAAFKQILGEAPYWLPQTEHRITPPLPADESDRFLYRHQDGYSNRGLPFRVSWVPLTDIDAETGGLAVAHGWNRRGMLHNRTGNPPGIPADRIPMSEWRISDYHPGDLLMFSISTPHSGIRNHAQRFRLSMDLRVMRASAQRPVVGEVVAIDQQSVLIRSEDGAETRLNFDENSYTRGEGGMEYTRAQAIEHLRPGSPVFASHEQGFVRMLRPRRGVSAGFASHDTTTKEKIH